MSEYLSDDDLASAKELIEGELLGKTARDFEDLGDRQRHFLFTLRYRYLEKSDFKLTTKQYKYLKDLLCSNREKRESHTNIKIKHYFAIKMLDGSVLEHQAELRDLASGKDAAKVVKDLLTKGTFRVRKKAVSVDKASRFIRVGKKGDDLVMRFSLKPRDYDRPLAEAIETEFLNEFKEIFDL